MKEFEKDIENCLGSVLDALDPDERKRTLSKLVLLVDREVRRETDRCVRLCKDRAELWHSTYSSEATSPASARDEARARSNEALFIADLIDAELDE